jgi:hypothetical protein
MGRVQCILDKAAQETGSAEIPTMQWAAGVLSAGDPASSFTY